MKIKNYKEIAKIAGCGVGTVSRYFSGGSISTEMYERIDAIVQRSNFVAKNPKNIDNIAVITTNILDYHTNLLIEKLAQKLWSQKLSLNIIYFDDQHQSLQDIIENLFQKKTKKIILLLNNLDELNHETLQTIEKYHHNLIIYGQKLPNHNCVYLNYEKMMYDLTLQLIAKYQNVLYISTLLEDKKELYRGYFKACHDSKIEPRYLHLKTANFKEDHHLLANSIADYQLNAVICVDEYSYLQAQSLHLTNLMIANLYSPALQKGYLKANSYININFESITDSLVQLLTNDNSEQLAVEIQHQIS
ncbi:hypothetical protein [Spiroplasma sp. DGKH1]|uniref:hypothetical protein n=1 Tax=Spiroplasma sp. DGKH1 TaxID=3050074 RepID=UPI0034C67C7C